MFIRLDHSTPAPLRYALTGHTVVEAFERGWERLLNGDLLNIAEASGFDILISADKNIRYQQNLSRRKIALIVLGNAQWPTLRRYTSRVTDAVNAATPAVTPRWKFPSGNIREKDPLRYDIKVLQPQKAPPVTSRVSQAGMRYKSKHT